METNQKKGNKFKIVGLILFIVILFAFVYFAFLNESYKEKKIYYDNGELEEIHKGIFKYGRLHGGEGGKIFYYESGKLRATHKGNLQIWKVTWRRRSNMVL